VYVLATMFKPRFPPLPTFRQPIPVDLKKADLAKEIADAKNAAYVYIGLGACMYVGLPCLRCPALPGTVIDRTRSEGGWASSPP
jgi:hypothetical protein